MKNLQPLFSVFPRPQQASNPLVVIIAALKMAASILLGITILGNQYFRFFLVHSHHRSQSAHALGNRAPCCVGSCGHSASTWCATVIFANIIIDPMYAWLSQGLTPQTIPRGNCQLQGLSFSDPRVIIWGGNTSCREKVKKNSSGANGISIDFLYENPIVFPPGPFGTLGNYLAKKISPGPGNYLGGFHEEIIWGGLGTSAGQEGGEPK